MKPSIKVAFLLLVISSVGNAWELLNPEKVVVGTRQRLRYEDDASLYYALKKEIFISSAGRDILVLTFSAKEERSFQEAVNVLNAKISAAKRAKRFLVFDRDASSLTSLVGSLGVDDGTSSGPDKRGSILELDPLSITFRLQRKNGKLISVTILSEGKPLLTIDDESVRGRMDGVTLDKVYSQLLGKLAVAVKQRTTIQFRPSWDQLNSLDVFGVVGDAPFLKTNARDMVRPPTH